MTGILLCQNPQPVQISNETGIVKENGLRTGSSKVEPWPCMCIRWRCYINTPKKKGEKFPEFPTCIHLIRPLNMICDTASSSKHCFLAVYCFVEFFCQMSIKPICDKADMYFLFNLQSRINKPRPLQLSRMPNKLLQRTHCGLNYISSGKFLLSSVYILGIMRFGRE